MAAMRDVAALAAEFERVFTPEQSAVLARTITAAYQDLVKTSDFNELKEIVRDLAQAQARTEVRMEELAQAQARTEVRMEELAQAQARTEVRMEELAQAQARTETRVDGLARSMEQLAQAQIRTESAVQELARQMQDTRREVSGIATTLGYALENEAYRALPDFLLRRYGIEVSSPLIRTEMNGREINFLAQGTRDGKPIVVVGEAKSRFDSVEAIRQVQAQVETARAMYPGVEIQPLLVTHYARPPLLERAQSEGIIVVQSFEW